MEKARTPSPGLRPRRKRTASAHSSRPTSNQRTLLRTMKSFIFVVAALAASTLAAADGRLVIKGSDTLGAKLVPQLAEDYKARNPGVSFEIAAEGSTTGISAIID